MSERTTRNYVGEGGRAATVEVRGSQYGRWTVTYEQDGEVMSDLSFQDPGMAIAQANRIENSLKAAGFRFQNKREDEVSAVSKDSDIRCPFCGEEDEDILYNLRTGGIECGGCGDHTVEELDAHIESIRTRWAAMSDKLKSLAGALR